jgi:hypothetical protein
VSLQTLVRCHGEIAAADDLAKEGRVIHDRAADHRRRRARDSAELAQPINQRRADFGLGGIRMIRHG